MTRQDRVAKLRQALQERILVLDGAMGTAIQDLDLGPEDFGGAALEGCNENLVLTRPNLIQKIHEDYLDAGADIVETNTFGGTPFVLEEFGLGSKAHEINLQATKLACAAAHPRGAWVAGSIGPTTKAISVTGGIEFDELVNQFEAQAKALHEGGCDYFLLETCQDSRNIKAALLAIDRVHEATGESLPIAISGTIEPMGTMLAGQSVEALLTSFLHKDLLYMGLNCATGPEFMTDHVRSLSGLSPFAVACVPNAGLPDEDGQYLETPDMVAAVVEGFMEKGWINVVGGCCGTTAGHITALAKAAKGKAPRKPQPFARSALSGVDYLEITDEMRPVLVGERTNVIGSRKFKRLIAEGSLEEASEIARAQIKTGAQIVDVCLANPDREELEDMRNFMEAVYKKIRVPFMIDSTETEVIEEALRYSQGKAIINSINLEDGEERFEAVVPMGLKYGAAFVVGCIDDDPEQGMGVSRERKLEIAERSYKLLTEKYGVVPEDIYWDPLVFPCATGDAQYVGSAEETIEGVRLIKEKFPRTKTVLGVSNVSFGLPPAGREVLNSVFMYHCVKSGLDLAIVNSEKLERYASIPKEEVELADDLLFNRGEDPVAAFAAKFRDRKAKVRESGKKMTLDERLSNYILEGSKDGLVDDLNEAMKKRPPLEIINGPLMAGMDEVGKLFNANQLIVAEVLQSAEAMKAAVAHLEPFMEKNESSSRGKVLLATVKGDVHDIGKNLVEIILANNGFRVINLGIKVPPEQLISAIREHQPDVVGLSGLLVKSAQQMIVTAEDFSKAGVNPPMLVGGAALSERFVDNKIAKAYEGTVAYASDAMNGLDLAKVITDPEELKKFEEDLGEKRAQRQAEAPKAPAKKIPVSTKRCSQISIIADPPKPTDYDRHVIRNTPVEQIWRYINPLMLYGRHLGIKGKLVKELVKAQSSKQGMETFRKEEPKAFAIWEAVEEAKREYVNSDIFSPKAVYQFFRADSAGNTLSLYPAYTNGNTPPMAKFEFGRQRKDDGLCLADYVAPRGEHHSDNVALFAVTAGQGVRELGEKLKDSGDYLKSHIVQVLALESAEAYAELLHAQIRKIWGFADPPETTMMERFQAKYRGTRYSFGYPACPRMDDQRILFDLIKPEEIGIELTDGFMMDPEASVSAVAFHHPESSYFSIGQVEENR